MSTEQLKEIPAYEFEYLNKDHAEEIVELDKKCCTYIDEDFGEIVHPCAWDVDSLRRFIHQRIPPTHGQVMRLSDSDTPEKIVAYTAYELTCRELPDSNNSVEVFHLISFAVDPDHRKLGLGLAMLVKLHGYALKSETRKTICIHVQEHDDASIAFFKFMNFESRFVPSYFGPDDDAIFFWFTEKKTKSKDEETVS